MRRLLPDQCQSQKSKRRIQYDTHKSGCSEKKTPYMSQVSRSYLLGVSPPIKCIFPFRHSPISSPEDRTRTWDSIRLSSIRLHADPTCVLEAQQIINHLKPLIPLREIHSRNVHNTLVLTLRMVTKESQDGNDARGTNLEGKFILEDRELLDESRK